MTGLDLPSCVHRAGVVRRRERLGHAHELARIDDATFFDDEEENVFARRARGRRAEVVDPAGAPPAAIAAPLSTRSLV